MSAPLARQGARVLGVDYSADLLAKAEHERGELTTDQLSYLQHDLREPIAETGFDVALNLFSSPGYGTEPDDERILGTLRSSSTRRARLHRHHAPGRGGGEPLARIQTLVAQR